MAPRMAEYAALATVRSIGGCPHWRRSALRRSILACRACSRCHSSLSNLSVESTRALSRDSKKTYHAVAVTVVPLGAVMRDYFCPLSYVDIPALW